MDEQERGYSSVNKAVCEDCVADDSLKRALLEGSRPDLTCDFCGRSPAAPFDLLLERVMKGLQKEYGRADDEGVYYDGGEGGYQWSETWSASDLIYEYHDAFDNDAVVQTLLEAIGEDTWVYRRFLQARRDHALSTSWREFCHCIKHETRHVFWLTDNSGAEGLLEDGYIPTQEILQEIGELLKSHNRIRTLPAGYEWYRARAHDEEVNWGHKELGTAALDCAGENRMSPEGIPMFYGAQTAQTAVLEISGQHGEYVTCGVFATSVDCKVIDLINPPIVPSLFDDRYSAEQRRERMFLRDFVEQLRQPPGTGSTLEYVPTQVVCEYLLKVFGLKEGIIGLVYRTVYEPRDWSSFIGSACVVFNTINEACVSADPGWDEVQEFRLGLVRQERYLNPKQSAQN